ncbi:hypothetical protein HDU92_001408 [Lobulomyces angularis]|nr:hypothetical protein HDU92_001408 [Lobulomyces angularis]
MNGNNSQINKKEFKESIPNLVRRLRKFEELSNTPEATLVDCLSTNNQKANHAKLKLITLALQKLDSQRLSNLCKLRKDERRCEVKENLALPGRQAHERAFNEVFNKFCEEELIKFGFKKKDNSKFDVFSNKKHTLNSLNFLLNLIFLPNDNTSTFPTVRSKEKVFSNQKVEERPKRRNLIEKNESLMRIPDSNIQGLEQICVIPFNNLRKLQDIEPPRKKESSSLSILKTSTVEIKGGNNTTINSWTMDEALQPISKPSTSSTLTSNSRNNNKGTTSAASVPLLRKKESDYKETSSRNNNADKNGELRNLSKKIFDLEQENLKLKKENDIIKSEIQAFKNVFEISTDENVFSSTKGDANEIYLKFSKINIRRSVLLKSKIVQLQRKNAALSEYYNYSRIEDIELLELKDFLKHALTSSKSFEELKKDVKKCLGKVENLRNIKFSTNYDRNTVNTENDSNFLKFFTEFLNPLHKNELNVVSLHNKDGLENLNLRHVSRLESQLHKFYGDLVTLEQRIKISFLPNCLPEFKEKMDESFVNSMDQLLYVMNNLLSLSTLLPTAPTPAIEKIQRVGFPEIPTLEQIIRSFPPMSGAFKEKVEVIITSLLNSVINYKELNDIENSNLKSELNFHKDIYEKHNGNIVKLVNALEIKKNTLLEEVEGIFASVRSLRERMISLQNNFNQENVMKFLEYIENEVNQILAVQVDQIK